MQILPKTAEWLVSEMGYGEYEIKGDPMMLYRPLISVYFGAAYLRWLSNFEGKERNEEFVVRTYRFGPKKATHKSTLDYWQRYLSVKQNLPTRRKNIDSDSSVPNDPTPVVSVTQKTLDLRDSFKGSYKENFVILLYDNAKVGDAWKYWDSRASPEDMEDLWKHSNVLKEWVMSGEKRGKVQFSLDAEKRTYLSRHELKAVAEIIVSKHFSTGEIKP
ncbi:hypothetical protein IFM89_038563, partial [Coptis chinensis]